METSTGPTVRRVGRPQTQEPVQEPAPAHVLSSGDNSDYDREATELQDAIFRHRVYLGPQEALPRGPPWWEAIKKFWRNNVVLSTSHVECRDHFANERTFLAYLRTSLALSMIGIVVAQLYRLQHSPNPGANFGYFVLSEPLSILFQVSAILVLLLGCVRFYRQQTAMSRGKVHVGGWDLYTVMGLMILLLTALFVLHITVTVWVEKKKPPLFETPRKDL